MITFNYRGGDNTRFVQSRLKKMKKISMKDPQWKKISMRPYHIKKSQLRHDAKCRRQHIRQKFGDQALNKS